MRVIAGSARSLKLKTLPGNDIRPTTDRNKETLFNILSPFIPGSRFLDLFSGSGGIGIEALSRGALEVYFIDSSFNSIKILEENLKFTRLRDNAKVLRAGYLTGLSTLTGTGGFDIIFMDPPFSKGLEKAALSFIAEKDLLKDDGKIVVEAATGTDFSYLSDLGLEIYKLKIYSNAEHVFICRSK